MDGGTYGSVQNSEISTKSGMALLAQAPFDIHSGAVSGSPAIGVNLNTIAMGDLFDPASTIFLNNHPWTPAAEETVFGLVYVSPYVTPTYALTLDPEVMMTANVADLSAIPEGTEVIVTITPPQDQVLASIMWSGIDIKDQIVDSTYTFLMPAMDVAITANFIPAPPEPPTPPGPQQGHLISVFAIDQKRMEITDKGVTRVEMMDVAPYIRNSRTMLPVRFVAQSLNMQVDYNEKTQDITIKDAHRSIKLNLNSNVAITSTSSTPYYLDSKPELVSDRTMLPIGEIADILGFSRTDQNNPGGYLAWDGQNFTVTLMVPVAP